MRARTTTLRRGRRAASPSSAELRAAVLRLGGLLGWPPDETAAFAEALNGRSWRHCGRVELQRVLAEYRELVTLLRAKQARRGQEVSDAAQD